jgi:uncharacterized protein (DUF1501 family)
MLDPDISTSDARRLLSAPHADDLVTGPHGWTRRRFLQALGAGVGGGLALGTFGEDLIPGDVREAFAGTPIGAGDGILVTIMLYGGNDGLNTVVPFGNGLYYDQRPNIAISPASVLRINDQIGFHPRLTMLKSMFDVGQVAVVQGVGYPNPDLSHFTSMAIWMNGRFGGGAATTGWIGRWLDGLPAGVADLAAASIDSSVALHLIGQNRRAVGISPYGDMFGTDTEPYDLRMYDGIRSLAVANSGRGQWADMFASTMRTHLDLAHDVAPVFEGTLPDDDLSRKMIIAGRLINANVGLRVIDVSLDGFDTHDDEATRHLDLMGALNDAIGAFYATVSPEFRDRVTILTMSEFGRTSYSNESGGTDHGTASDLFVIGSNVKGGLYGQAPSLAVADRWDRLEHTVDFRHVLGTTIDGWMGGGASTILQGQYENLGFFKGSPGTAGTPPPVIVLPPATPSGFVAATPRRVFDTRDGTGGRAWAVAQGESWSFTLAGKFGIPADAVAVAINVTSVDATAGTFVTVYPSGEARPFASNLNPVPGSAVPNLVLARVGLGGAIQLFNNTGAVHLVGDVVGWFTPSSDVGLEPLSPGRLLDTRDGTGGRLGAIGPGQSVDLQVSGREGVAGDCVAVALNVTATEPTLPSFLTVWPTGEPRPLASSVNMVTNQTVPNMVLSKVGAGGKVSIYNNTGTTHVVVDVLGCFRSGSGSRFVTVSPARVLDTREGLGGPKARLGRGELTVPLAGRGGVPQGATAALLNVIAVSPSAGTFVTVYPSGVERPLASNLNAVAGQVVPNMVIARLGDDGGATLYNNTGDVDLVADVMGYFQS